MQIPRQPQPPAETRCPATRDDAAPEPGERSPLWERVALRPPGAAAEQEAQGEGAGRPLAPAERARMERAFGQGLGHVRLHEDADTGGALAAAAGSHVALSPVAPRPGTPAGDALLAHELAHTLQQARATSTGGGSPAELEAEADAAAVSALTGAPMPRLQSSGLQLRSCSYSEADKQHVAELMIDPGANQAELLALVDQAGNSLPDLLFEFPLFSHHERRNSLRQWAGMPGAQVVLQRIADRLRPMSGSLATVILDNVDTVLNERTRPDAPRTQDELDALAKVQTALDTDPRKPVYTDPTRLNPPLRLPVKMYEPGRAEAGQVYYDPHLSRTSDTAGATVKGGETTIHAGDKSFRLRFQPYILLGPLALGSNEFIRSAMYHEYLHYLMWVEEEKEGGDPVARELKGMDDRHRDPSGKLTERDANEDTEILGRQIRDDAPRLSVKEIAPLLSYLAMQLDSGFVRADYRQRCFAHIASAAADPATRKKLLAALKESPVNDADRTVLADLKAMIKAAAAPAPPPAKGR